MRVIVKFAMLAIATMLFTGQVAVQQAQAQAQAQQLDAATAEALNNALAAGDARAVQLIIAAVQGDAAATQAAATIILAAAQSIKAADPGGAGVLAAIALTSGGLQGNAAASATNLVNVSGSAIAATVVALASAGVPPSVVANAVLVGVTVNPVQIAQSGSQVAPNNNAGSVQ